MKMTKEGILILGMLLERPKSPYEMVSIAQSIDPRYWFAVADQTFYGDIRKFSKIGYLTGTPSRTGNRPEKTIFQLSESGRAVVQKAILDYLDSDDTNPEMFKLAILYLPYLDRSMAKVSLEHRLKLMSDERQRYLDRQNIEDGAYKPGSISMVEEFYLRIIDVEIRMTEQLLDRLQGTTGLEPYLLSFLEGRTLMPVIDVKNKIRIPRT